MEKTKKEKSAKKELGQEATKVQQKQKSAKHAEAKEKTVKEKFVEEKVPIRLLEIYRKEIVPELSKKFNYKNTLQAPALEKISLNVGAGAATLDPKLIDSISKDVEMITGQKPVITKA